MCSSGTNSLKLNLRDTRGQPGDQETQTETQTADRDTDSSQEAQTADSRQRPQTADRDTDSKADSRNTSTPFNTKSNHGQDDKTQKQV